MRRLALMAALAAAVLLPAGIASAQSAQPRVVGGQAVNIAEYPWQAALVRTDGSGNDFNRQFCGGSLVTSRIVLTAAHCVFDTDTDGTAQELLEGGDGTPRLDPEDVIVVLGVTTLSQATAGDEQAVDAVAYQGDTPPEMPIYNPDFPAPPNGVPENDVAYLVLSAAPVTPQPIKIAGTGEEPVWAPGVFAEITGWGSTFFGGSHVNSLRAGSVPIVSDPTCAADYGIFFDQSSMICAGYQAGGVDTCQGDSGGPLESALAPGAPDAATYRLVGITSWGEGCAEPGFPGVYTRVAETALRDAIVAKVDALEAANGIGPPASDEVIVGTGGTPLGGGPKYPPPPVSPAAPSSVTLPPTGDPFAKCKKIPKNTKKQRKKRKACNKNVQRALGI